MADGLAIAARDKAADLHGSVNAAALERLTDHRNVQNREADLRTAIASAPAVGNTWPSSRFASVVKPMPPVAESKLTPFGGQPPSAIAASCRELNVCRRGNASRILLPTSRTEST